jgi:hypothetical protein
LIMSRFPHTEWELEQIRTTVFPVPGASSRRPEWWQGFTGEEPDQTSANPKKGSSQVVGSFLAGKLHLKLEPERIDWVYGTANEGAELPPSTFPALGRIGDVVPSFAEKVRSWLGDASVPELGRLAVGAVLLHPEPNQRAGYSRLPDYVPVEVSPDSSDFIYQINLPAPSALAIPGLRVNRLSKWSMAAWRVLALTNGGTAVGFRDPSYALRLELDINTVPDASVTLPRSEWPAIFDELVAVAIDIATNGVRQR